jgi:hypothetical protein
MFCRKAPSRWNFAELKLRACQIQRSARLNRKQKKLTNLLIFTFPSIALRVEGLWARDKPDYHVQIQTAVSLRTVHVGYSPS